MCLRIGNSAQMISPRLFQVRRVLPGGPRLAGSVHGQARNLCERIGG